ncbi:MAG: Mur ligase family protein, partial [Solirubrobacteraceae bacterium]
MRFSELDGRTIALWGLGRETTALREQVRARLPGARIAALIDQETPEREARAAIRAADVLVRSPGVSIYGPLIQEAIAAGVKVTTATALWLAQRGGAGVIGVTGTKGKSTTATVIAHLLSANAPVALAGNIGRAVIELLDLADKPGTWVVLELSSYQIADLEVGPEVAVITNLSREHTDWHGSEERYRADKLRIFELPGTRVAVKPPEGGWPLLFEPGQLPLRGAHNVRNVSAAVTAIAA